jgi:ATP-dependent Zn protease
MIPSFSFFREIMNIARDKRGENQYLVVAMSKKVYKEMVKYMNIIAS